MKKMKESTIVVCEILGASFNTSFIAKLTAVFKDRANFRKCSELLWLSTAFAAFGRISPFSAGLFRTV
jgi:hypothetical protein